MNVLYIVSNDLFAYLNKRMSFPNDKINKVKQYLNDFEFKFLRKLSFFLPENITIEEISNEKIYEWLNKEEKNCGYEVISIDDVHSSSKLKIHINRLLVMSKSHKKVILSNRPGTLPLEIQIEKLARRIKSRYVAISDIGIWNGYTALFVSKLLAKHGIKVKLGIFPIVRRIGFSTVSKEFGVKYMVIGNFYEWIELRDLLVSGMPISNKNRPAIINGVEFRVPYWFDEYTLSELAGFYNDLVDLEKIRDFLIKNTIKLLRKLSKITKTRITVSHLGYYSNRIINTIDPEEEVIERVENIAKNDLN